MLRYAAGRLAGMAGTLLVTSFVIFVALYLAPGKPESFLLQGRTPSPGALEAIRAQYHLDEPFLQQYWLWFGGILEGDFGRSIQFRQDVGALLVSRLPTTLLLVAMATVLMLVLGTMLGVASALRPGAVDKSVLIGSTVAVATPTFIAAVVLIGFFSVRLGWFPTFGNGDGLLDRLYHLVLPGVALSAPLIGLVSRVTRASLLTELGRDHVDVARARGIPERLVIWRHVARGAVPPVLTLSGTIVAGLFVGSAIIETAFGISGLGQLLVQSVTTKDFPVVQAICLLLVGAFAATNLLVDLVLPALDPRVRLERQARP